MFIKYLRYFTHTLMRRKQFSTKIGVGWHSNFVLAVPIVDLDADSRGHMTRNQAHPENSIPPTISVAGIQTFHGWMICGEFCNKPFEQSKSLFWGKKNAGLVDS